MPQSFADFALPTAVVNALTKDGKTAPFPIQTATLPDTLAGRDVLGRGRTGSGKTLAFSLPMVTRLDATRPEGRRRAARPRGLVLAPTRELASQIDATLAPLAKALGLTTTVIFGGVAQSRQVNALAAGVDIVVACPGRLEDLLGQRHLVLDDVEITVLDEADHMADLGFLPGVKRIMDRTPQRGQRMLFSATLDNGVDVLVKRYLHDPLHHSVDSAESPVAAMTHHIFEVADAGAKRDVVAQLAQGANRRILFTRTKHQAKKLAKTLTAEGIPAVDLHGNLSQGARERNLEAFSTGAVKVLCATDIAARGIHVDDVELVVHVDPPAEHKAYLHRSGRTARAGHGGDVVTVMLPEQRGDMKDLTRKAKIAATPQRVRAGDALLAELVGDVAPFVAPSAAPVAAQPAPKQQRRVKTGTATEGGRGSGRGGQGGSRRQGASGGSSAEGGRARSGRGRGAGSAPTTYSTTTPSGSGRSGQARTGSGAGGQARPAGASRQGASSGRAHTAADFSRGRRA